MKDEWAVFMTKIAVIDGHGLDATVDLYLEDDNGDVTNIEWPQEWPSWVTVKFMEEQGFTVKTA